VKANEVYKVVREVVGPWCRSAGFKRTGSLGWYAPVGDHEVLTFWFQISRDGWDDYAGAKFVVAFLRADSPTVEAQESGAVAHRLAHFLSDEQLATVKAMQNDVIRKLARPGRGYFIHQCPPDVVAWYEAKFDLVTKDYQRKDDIWLRYKDEEDVRRWARFVVALLPGIVARMARQSDTGRA
jgi:hypothetical protein